MNKQKNRSTTKNAVKGLNETEFERQHRYVEDLKKKGEASFSLIATEAFVEGMRDSGYRSTGTAIDEFIDNSIQAQAERIDVVYTMKKPKGGKREISHIAVIDDGHGMEPDMIRAAVLWGGTHRVNDRSGFGRYGFGLPSAAVSIVRCYEVYSRTNGHGWHKVTIDLKEICEGKYTDDRGIVLAPPAVKTELPDFVEEYLGSRKLTHGTVILLIAPDRLTAGYRIPQGFHKKLMQHLGIIYRHMLRNHQIYVNGEKIKAVDPLFLDPAARYYDLHNGIMAQSRDELLFDVKTLDGEKTGSVRLRFSYMPPGFQMTDEKRNGRFPIMRENNAYFIVTRAGRQIDLVQRAHFPKEAYNKVLVNYDRNWAVELDFDPVLDEDFGITVNKQQIEISDRMWAIFQDQAIGPMTKALWDTFSRDRRKQKAEVEKERAEDQTRESEQVMAESEKFIRKPAKVSPEKEEKAKLKVLEEAEKKAKETGRPKDEHVREIVEQIQKRPYKIVLESKEGAPFFRPEQFGSQKRLYINTDHRFYWDIYAAPDSTPRVKSALELLLYAIGFCEIEATGDLEIFYEEERLEWSKRLRVALTVLDRREPVEDNESAIDATAEAASAAG